MNVSLPVVHGKRFRELCVRKFPCVECARYSGQCTRHFQIANGGDHDMTTLKDFAVLFEKEPEFREERT